MKAREIQRQMLEKYQRAINCYNEDVIRVRTAEDKVRGIETDLKNYFNITKRHPLGEVEVDIPF